MPTEDNYITLEVYAEYYDNGENGVYIGETELDPARMPDELEINGIMYVANK